ncbi:chorismate mutase [Desulforudis sp. 1088]|uniref:chorismate mutase n=1 Tax=Desulforudis sp. Tu-874 TaxID=3416276 RepID=UPI003CE50295
MPVSPVRGIRGAITVSENTAEEIIRATMRLLEEMVKANNIDINDIASVFLTMTPDLNAEFPALAARKLGWANVPLLGATEIAHPTAIGKCIRVLVHVNTDKSQAELRHLYLDGAARLRPDLLMP